MVRHLAAHLSRVGAPPAAGRRQRSALGEFRVLSVALSGGTGAYKGISGKGTYQFNELAILAKAGGKCTMQKPPVAFQLLIKASATVTL